MAGRHRMSRGIDDRQSFRDDPQPIVHRASRHLPPHPAVLEEELEIQHREIQKIMGENRHLVDGNVFLQSELTAVKDEIHRLSQILPAIRADKEAQTRELVERGFKLEAELQSAEPLRAEVVQLRAESQKLNTLRQELSTKIQTLNKDVNRCKADNQQVASMKADIEGMHKELTEARRVYEFDKKANEELAEQNQAMETDLVSMAREIEKLRAEQARVYGIYICSLFPFCLSPTPL
ncbi:OLC1v1032296C4 [Oldenlandia corymbosa var. corymbosa]|uniref:OLC1v1032296C4 n=1 Tax=Oldenlandia corymbosa var. corymbosa TaxID=529605 RepID=A0AAV1CNL7_OLDCO|nr:OLC1v1032296C4 [Oldenlandia corymbosa var. corymbosa]